LSRGWGGGQTRGAEAVALDGACGGAGGEVPHEDRLAAADGCEECLVLAEGEHGDVAVEAGEAVEDALVLEVPDDDLFGVLGGGGGEGWR
jgi:hypothetical protein